jgi:hypothetical protein
VGWSCGQSLWQHACSSWSCSDVVRQLCCGEKWTAYPLCAAMLLCCCGVSVLYLLQKVHIVGVKSYSLLHLLMHSYLHSCQP